MDGRTLAYSSATRNSPDHVHIEPSVFESDAKALATAASVRARAVCCLSFVRCYLV